MTGTVKLTERSDGTIYLQCRCGEIGQPCPYQGEITSSTGQVSLLRRAKTEAFEHCWSAHRIAAWAVEFDVAYYRTPPPQVPVESLLVTTEPGKIEALKQEKKAGA